MNFLIINGHQRYEGIAEGNLNRAMVQLAKEELEKAGHIIKITEVEKGYVVEEELQKHLWADVIFLQMPTMWFGFPWKTKKYIDEVLTAGYGTLWQNDGRTRKDPLKQYGTGGLMQGKKFALSVTGDAPANAFNDEHQYMFSGLSVDDSLIGVHGNYRFCGAEVLPVFIRYDVEKNPDAENDVKRFKAYLKEHFKI